MSAQEADIGRCGVSHGGIRSGIDCRAAVVIPGFAHPALFHLVVHEFSQFLFRLARRHVLEGVAVDLLGRFHGSPDAFHFTRGLAPAQAGDDRLSGDEFPGMRGFLEVPCQDLVHAVGQAVCGRIVGRGVDRDLLGIEPVKDAQEVRTDGLVVGDHLIVSPRAPGCLGFVAPEDGDPFPIAGDDQGGTPGECRAVNERQHRVGNGAGLANEGQPGVNL